MRKTYVLATIRSLCYNRGMFRPSKEPCKCGSQKSQIARTCWKCRIKATERACVVCGTKFYRKPSIKGNCCGLRCRDKRRNAIRVAKDIGRRIKIRCEFCGV